MLFERLELIFEIPSTTPTRHIPARPIPRLEPWTPLFQRKLIQPYQETSVEAEIMLLMLHPRRIHVAAEDVNVQMVHRRMRMHACDNIFGPVAAWGQESGVLRGGWWVRGAGHEGFQGGDVGFV